MTAETSKAELLALTTDIVRAHVSNNTVAVSDLPTLIGSVHASLSKLGSIAVVEVPAQQPAVSVKVSVKPDHLVCLECGKKQKTLKRHLMTSHGLMPEAYRVKWSLHADYPMVSPNYAAQRRELAIGFGLGRKAGSDTAAAEANAAVTAESPKKRGRPKLGIATS